MTGTLLLAYFYVNNNQHNFHKTVFIFTLISGKSDTLSKLCYEIKIINEFHLTITFFVEPSLILIMLTPF